MEYQDRPMSPAARNALERLELEAWLRNFIRREVRIALNEAAARALSMAAIEEEQKQEAGE